MNCIMLGRTQIMRSIICIKNGVDKYCTRNQNFLGLENLGTVGKRKLFVTNIETICVHIAPGGSAAASRPQDIYTAFQFPNVMRSAHLHKLVRQRHQVSILQQPRLLGGSYPKQRGASDKKPLVSSSERALLAR